MSSAQTDNEPCIFDFQQALTSLHACFDTQATAGKKRKWTESFVDESCSSTLANELRREENLLAEKAQVLNNARNTFLSSAVDQLRERLEETKMHTRNMKETLKALDEGYDRVQSRIQDRTFACAKVREALKEEMHKFEAYKVQLMKDCEQQVEDLVEEVNRDILKLQEDRRLALRETLARLELSEMLNMDDVNPRN